MARGVVATGAQPTRLCRSERLAESEKGALAKAIRIYARVFCSPSIFVSPSLPLLFFPSLSSFSPSIYAFIPSLFLSLSGSFPLPALLPLPFSLCLPPLSLPSPSISLSLSPSLSHFPFSIYFSEFTTLPPHPFQIFFPYFKSQPHPHHRLLNPSARTLYTQKKKEKKYYTQKKNEEKKGKKIP